MKRLSSREKTLIGVVHVRALPGTPRSEHPVDELCRIAVEEAKLLAGAGFDALIVENMHDVPYLKRTVGPEITSAMTAVARAVTESVDCPIGVQVLAGANREALAVAQASGARFIRTEGFVFAHVADEGVMESDAGELLRYRKMIGADEVMIFADIKKKHASHALTSDVTLADTAHAAEFFGVDAIVITGSATGRPTSPDDLKEARKGCSLPRMVGSGVTPENLPEMWPHAEGFIVGSFLKEDGGWDRPIDPARVEQLLQRATRLRDNN